MNQPVSDNSTPSIRDTPPPESQSDSQTTQMRSQLVTASTEKEHLSSQIKEARRSSQRAEAALRQEIDAVRKAVEKAGTLDLRAKQKALALQEQVKQAWAGSETAEKETQAVEQGMSEVEARMDAARAELEACKEDMKRAREREEDARERDRRSRQEEEKKLAEVASKVEKLKVKKEKKEGERAELERRIEELEKQREDVERRGEEDARRRLGDHWEHEHKPHGHFRRFQPRFPAAVRPTGSPTHANFTPFRPPPKPGRTGTNASAAPFVPGMYDPSHHTALMPPSMQHRIYLPNNQHVRPRPTPTFHPPPSVIAEQAAQAHAKASPTTASPPAFPPLPGAATGKQNVPSGPSLASIVTKAVLSPTSTLGGRPSPPIASPTSSSPTPPASSMPPMNHRVSFGPPPNQERPDFPPLSPTGPWASLNPTIGARARGERKVERRDSGGYGIERARTPPTRKSTD